MLAQRLRVWGLDRGGLIALCYLVLLVWVAPRHIVDGDNAEFVTIGALGGVPHPSGYPLYVLLLRATSWLPGANPAHTASIVTAVLGAATILVLHAACRAWGARPLAATLAVGLFAAAPVTLRTFSEAEVFALNSLVVATIVWLSARDAPIRGIRRVVLLGLLAGLGLSNHSTCVLIAPVGIWGVVRGTREATSSWLVCVGLALVGLVIGLLPYGYFLFAPDTPISWRRMTGLGDLVHHFLRLDYGSFGTFAPNRAPIPGSHNVEALVEMLGRSWLWGPLVLGVIVLGLRSIRGDPEAREGRWSWALLAASIVIAGPVLASRFNVPPHGVGLAIVHRFHVLPAMLLALPIAMGLLWLGARIAARVPALAKTGTALVLAAIIALASRSLPHHSPAVQYAVQNMLAPLPENAVVIVSEDDLYFGSAYVQLVLGQRQDVTVIAFTQLLNPEYRTRLHERRGVVLLTPGNKQPSIRIAEDAFAAGKPMFVDSTASNLLKVFPSYPFGTLFRVLPPGSPRPTAVEIYDLNKRVYETFTLDYVPPSKDDDYAAHAHERYARIWRIITRGLLADGKHEQAATADVIARQLAP